ncbi:MAG: tetratricopeptide repeat protein [candidate division WOR-3 bacterium]
MLSKCKPIARSEIINYGWHLFFILFLTGLTFVIYFNTLKNGFVYDDKFEIVDNQWIRNFKNLFSECHRYRLTETFTLFADYKIWGIRPCGFHLTNMFFHILTSVMIYALTYLILKEKWGAFLTGLLFATHPIHTEAVAIISHRQEILVMLFIMLGLIFYIRQQMFRNYVSILASVICFGFALCAKEVAFVFPLLLLLYDFYFGNKIELKYYLPYLIIFIIFLLLFSIPSPRWNFKISGFDVVSFGHSLSGNRSYFSILITQVKAFSQYVKLLFFPHPLNIDYYFPAYTSILQDYIWLSLLLLIFLIFLAVITYRHNKVISFGIAWFLINLLPVSNILPKTFFLAERYLYIPSFGFCLVLGWILSKGILRKSTKVLSLIILVSIIIFYSIKTIQRNYNFKSEYTLWLATLKNNPKSVHGHNNVGIGLFESGKIQDAIKEFEMAILLAPTYAKPYYNLGIAYFQIDNYEKAIENIKMFIKFEPKSAEGYAGLGTIYHKLRKYDDAIKNLTTAIKYSPQNLAPSLHYTLGTVYRDAGRYDDAISEFITAIKLNPQFGEAHNDLGIEYGRKKLYDEAIREFESAIRLMPNSAQTYYNLAIAYIKKGDNQKAQKALENCLKYKHNENIINIQKILNELKSRNEKIKSSTP